MASHARVCAVSRLHLLSAPFILEKTMKRIILSFAALVLTLAFFGEAKADIGTVAWYIPSKGYGFIKPKRGDRSIYVDAAAVQRANLPTLEEGWVVQYEILTRRGKSSAINLVLISEGE